MSLGPAEITHGPMFIGVTFNLVLYGIMVTQTTLYFTTFKDDRAWTKLFVLLLFIADTANAVFDTVYLYRSLVVHFGDVQHLQNANWVFLTNPAMTGIIASAVQLFYSWRVKVLTQNNFLVAIIVISALASCLSAIGSAIAGSMIPQFTDFRKFQVVVIIWLGGAALSDVLITVSLVWHLKEHKTGVSITDDLVDRIIRLTVQTGMITSICAVVNIITFLVSRTGLHLIFNMPLSKLYTNSLMSSLNARNGWISRRTINHTPSNGTGEPDLRWLAPSTGSAYTDIQLGTRSEVEGPEQIELTQGQATSGTESSNNKECDKH